MKTSSERSKWFWGLCSGLAAAASIGVLSGPSAAAATPPPGQQATKTQLEAAAAKVAAGSAGGTACGCSGMAEPPWAAMACWLPSAGHFLPDLMFDPSPVTQAFRRVNAELAAFVGSEAATVKVGIGGESLPRVLIDEKPDRYEMRLLDAQAEPADVHVDAEGRQVAIRYEHAETKQATPAGSETPAVEREEVKLAESFQFSHPVNAALLRVERARDGVLIELPKE
jgi:HSP20 family molecular chaperone IbpA